MVRQDCLDPLVLEAIKAMQAGSVHAVKQVFRVKKGQRDCQDPKAIPVNEVPLDSQELRD